MRLVALECLETRSLLSGMTVGQAPTAPAPGAAVAADLAKIGQDKTTMGNDFKTLATDQQAVGSAAAGATKGAFAHLKTDTSSWESTINADRKSLQAATSDAARQSAQAKLTTDQAAAQKAISDDLNEAESEAAKDPGVQSARAKVQADGKAVAADQVTLQADSAQLQKDQQDSQGHPTTPTTTHSR